MLYKYVTYILKEILLVLLVALTPEHLKFTVSMGDWWDSLEGRREHICLWHFVLPVYCFCFSSVSSGNPELILVVWTPSSVWWLHTTEQMFGVVSLSFFSKPLASSRFLSSRLFPFLLFFRRSLVSLFLTKTVFSTIVLLSPGALIISSLHYICFSLSLAFSPQHKHVLPKETSASPFLITVFLEGMSRLVFLRFPSRFVSIRLISHSAQAVRGQPFGCTGHMQLPVEPS